jgi:hypothetical protein
MLTTKNENDGSGTVRLVRFVGRVGLGTLTLLLACVAPASPASVKVGRDGFLLVDGQSHFVIGLYQAGHYEEMANAGFSATHNYGVSAGKAEDATNSTDAHLKDLLDRNYTNGLRMMVELPREAIEKGNWEQLTRRLETFRSHPGLLCWGSEERVARGRTGLTNIARLYQLVHKLDPDHPFVLGDTKDVIKKFQHDRRDFFPDPCMDIGIWWWYPIPLKDPDGNGVDQPVHTRMEPPLWLTTTHSRKPLWIAIQAYQHPSKEGRFPTPEEYRCMAYLSIINGVKGLFFYTGSGQRDFEGKPAGILNKPELGRWDYVKTLARELREFSPAIMSKPIHPNIVVSPPDAPVEFTMRRRGDDLFLVAANKSSEPQTVTFTGSQFKDRTASVLYEEHPAQINGNSLRDEFVPFGVHLYSLRRGPLTSAHSVNANGH